MKRVLYWVLVLACLGGVLTGGYMTGSQLLAYRAAGQAYEELSGYISSTAAEDASETQGTSSGSERVLPAGVRVDFDGLSEVIFCRMAGCNQVNIQIHVINRSGRYAQLAVAVEERVGQYVRSLWRSEQERSPSKILKF